MKELFDRYSLRARAFPVFVTLTPLLFAITSWLPEGLDWKLGGVAAILLMPLSYLAGQLGADPGKHIEKNLWQKWDGPPTTRFLRHSNNEFSSPTRERIHNKLRCLGLRLPTKEEEDRDPKAADLLYETCTKELIRRTRDRTRFPLVFENLTDYGFRRNLLGLKPVGLPVAFLAFLVCLWRVWAGWGDPQELPVFALGAAVLVLGIVLVWVLWVNESAVRLAADRYARSLLEAALELED